MEGSKSGGRNAVTILRSIGAVVAGYLVEGLLVMTLVVLAVIIVPQWQETADGAYLATNMMLNVIAAIAGGYVCARLSPDRPLGHALALLSTIPTRIDRRRIRKSLQVAEGEVARLRTHQGQS